MMRLRGVLACCSMLFLLVSPAFGYQPPQSEFVPVAPGTATEQLPAAPLVIGAYAFVWTALIVYLWSIWRRIGKVEADLRAFDRRSGARSGVR